MRRTLERGTRFGFATGLGASLADGFYGAVAAFGIAAISTFLESHYVPVRTVGGLFMIFLAARLIRAPTAPRVKKDPATTGRMFGALFSGFFLTVTNPMTLVGFAAVFTTFHLAVDTDDRDLATLLVVGVILGSTLWWLALCVGIRRLRHLLSDRALRRINIVAGGILGILGAYALLKVAMKIWG
jgi:threonine/homoserine/homoserine lactone efflux protein